MNQTWLAMSTIIILGICSLYGLGAFIALEPNAANWTHEGRIAFVIISVAFIFSVVLVWVGWD